MRRVCWGLLLIFVFAIPWEYSLELGAPFGNIARVTGLVLVLAAVPTILLAGRMRNLSPLHWLVLALYLWFCCTYFWTLEHHAALEKVRGYFQEMMIVWLVWEFAESPAELRELMRAWLAGSWVLAILTVTNLAFTDVSASGQFRFVPVGQDPNDVARFLVFGFPLAALLLSGETRWLGRLLALGYFPMGLAAVLLTASRSGLLTAAVALGGCGILLLRNDARRVFAGVFVLPVVGSVLWFIAPHETLERLGTITEQLHRGDLNQRLNIWGAGWRAFVQAPLFGHGAGSFVSAAGLAPTDTAHNTAVSILVEGGLCALFIAVAIVVVSVRSAFSTKGSMRLALIALLAVWILSSMVGTVMESRHTWLLLALIALAGRFAVEVPELLERAFPSVRQSNGLRAIDGVE